MSSNQFTLRVRYPSGTLRLTLTNQGSSTIAEVKGVIAEQISNCPSELQHLSKNGLSHEATLSNAATLSYLNIQHGDMIYLKIIDLPLKTIYINNNNNHNNLNNNSNSNNNNSNNSNNNSNNKKRKHEGNEILKPAKRLKQTPKPFTVHTINNNGIIINDIGDGNELNVNNNINIDELKPPKQNTPQHKLIEFAKTRTINEKKFVMYLIIILCSYYGWNVPFSLTTEPDRIEEILNKFYNKPSIKPSHIRFITNNVCGIMGRYNDTWVICNSYITKYASDSNIKTPNDLILPFTQHTSLSLILLTILCGGDKNLINMVQTISDCAIVELESEFEIEYSNYCEENKPEIKLFIVRRITAIICGICRYCSDGNKAFNL